MLDVRASEYLRVFCSEDGDGTWNHGPTPFLEEICSTSRSYWAFWQKWLAMVFFMLLVTSVDSRFQMFEVENGGASWTSFAPGGFLTVLQYFEIFSTNTQTFPCHNCSFVQVFVRVIRAPFSPGHWRWTFLFGGVTPVFLFAACGGLVEIDHLYNGKSGSVSF